MRYMSGSPIASPKWHFRRMRPDEPFEGDVEPYAFDYSIDAFVREVVQNSTDQRVDASRPARVEFRFFEQDLKTLLKQEFIGWKTIEAHFKHLAQGQGHNTAHFRNLLSRVGATDKGPRTTVISLVVSDSNTAGLDGPLLGIKGNFCNLLRNKLVTKEPGDRKGGGGTFGIGKSVWWASSETRQVWFSTAYQEGPEIRRRMMGRTYLADHYDKGSPPKPWSGDAYFGIESSVDGESVTMPLEGDAVLQFANGTPLERVASQTGTTGYVPFFEDPSAESQPSIEELAAKTVESLGRNFWPMISAQGLEAVVVTRDLRGRESTTTVPVPQWSGPFLRALQAPLADVISEAAGVGSSPIVIQVPSRKDGGHGATVTNADLCVAKLSDSETPLVEAAGLLNKVAYVRGPQMVIKYEQAIGQKGSVPHHVGVVRLGHYSLERSSIQEQFIADSEPPSHNNIASSRKLRDNYVVGYQKAIRSLYEQVWSLGRNLLGRTDDGSDKPPKKLDEMLAGRTPKPGNEIVIPPTGVLWSSGNFSLVWEGETAKVEVELRRGRLAGDRPISIAVAIVAVGENGTEPLNHLPYDIEKPPIVNATRIKDGKGWHVDLPLSQQKTRLVVRADVSKFDDNLKSKIRASLDLRANSGLSTDDVAERSL